MRTAGEGDSSSGAISGTSDARSSRPIARTASTCSAGSPFNPSRIGASPRSSSARRSSAAAIAARSAAPSAAGAARCAARVCAWAAIATTPKRYAARAVRLRVQTGTSAAHDSTAATIDVAAGEADAASGGAGGALTCAGGDGETMGQQPAAACGRGT